MNVAANIIEPDYNVPKVLRVLIEYLRANEPYGPLQLTDPEIQFANKVGYVDAIRNIEKFIVEGGHDRKESK